MTPELAVQAALVGPAAAGLVWLLASRWVPARRIALGVVGLAAHAAAWWVLVIAFRGEAVSWRTFDPGLLGASVAVAAQIGIGLALLHAEGHEGHQAPGLVVGLAVAASAVTATAWTGSLAVVAIALPIPTLAAAGAALGGPGHGAGAVGRGERRRPDVRGLASLAAADLAALGGLAVILVRSGSVTVPHGIGVGVGTGLVLGAAAVKAGAIPWLGTWRLATGSGPGASARAALRGHGVALAALAGPVTAGFTESAPTVWIAAGAVLLAGILAVGARERGQVLASVAAIGAAIPFLAVGLGGALGARAFLLAFPAYLIAAAAADLVAWPAEARDRPVWRRLAQAGLAVGVISLLGLPFGAGFPATWLGAGLLGARMPSDLLSLVPLALLLGGIGAGALAVGPLVRSARAGASAAIASAALALGLVYVGTQPVRLALGWYLRIEGELGAPRLLPAAGGPTLPVLGDVGLLILAAPAIVAVVAVVLLGRGLRDAGGAFQPVLEHRRRARRARLAWLGPLRETGRIIADELAAFAVRARRLALGFVLGAVLELGAIALAGWVVLRAAARGFL